MILLAKIFNFAFCSTITISIGDGMWSSSVAACHTMITSLHVINNKDFVTGKLLSFKIISWLTTDL